MSTRKTLEEKIAEARLEAKQKQNLVKELQQQQRAKERKDRTHRFCVRGGKLEGLLPDLARLTEDQFEVFVEKVLLTPHTSRILTELAPPSTETAAYTNTANIGSAKPKPMQSAQNVNVSGNASGSNGIPAQAKTVGA